MIFTFGDVILDILVNAHGKLRMGSDVVGKIRYSGGGSAANFATWIAYLNIPVTFLGKIGDDYAGYLIRRELRHWKVQAYLKIIPGLATGTILVLLEENGERTMITDRAVNLQLGPEDIREEFFVGCKHLHFTGYTLFHSRSLVAAAHRAVGLAKEHGVTISLDPSSYALLEELGIPAFLELSEGVDFLFPNLDEGKLLTGRDTPAEIVEQLLAHFPHVVLSLGEAGCVVGTEQGVWEFPTTPHTVVDTVGAGDAFTAGYLASYLQAGDITLAAKQGNAVAGECVQLSGGRPPRSFEERDKEGGGSDALDS